MGIILSVSTAWALQHAVNEKPVPHFYRPQTKLAQGYVFTRVHPEETSKNSDNCDFSKVSDIGNALQSTEN